ncbi:hypothetical protein BGZ95_011864 [Linnemannia exigua]|uniref:Uncharacterized protein n=1 Tax=Linnemannia exigua TaxID=604196 RepID=A0AAD4H4Y8_9FUNG|nr:hypothetical protein BGZ95_011864 [Linnemannia exigua]
MFASILLVSLALAASLVVEAKPDIVFYTERYSKGTRYRCEELDYQTCYTAGSFPQGVQSLDFTNYDFPDHKDFSITIYSGSACNNKYDRWSFTQRDNGKGSTGAWKSLTGVASFEIANFLTSQVANGDIGSHKEPTKNPNCWREE